ncbi:MAG: SLC13 family permease, partial [Candidatus Eisenbacteria bacterium]|nr:SLC13 family permease [Candidatus Eisenbacteria bacterium]
MESVILIGIILGAFVLFVTQVVRTEITALAILAALALSGILEMDQVLAGFSSPATITVGAMLILSEGLSRAGVADYAAALLERWAGSAGWRILLALGLTVGFFSAFMNNTAIVAITIPIVLTLCQRKGHAPSKYLLPVSYFAILGGTCTLVGTSTNIIVDSLSRSQGGPSFAMFEFTGLGVICLAVGIACILLLARTLPVRSPLSLMLSPRARSQFVTEISIPARSRYAGRALREMAREIRVLELFRGDDSMLNPDADLPVREGDILLIEGSARAIRNLMINDEVALATAVADEERVSIRQIDRTVTELVITPNSRFVGQRMKDVGLRRRYGILVMAARRLGMQHHMYGLRKMGLRPGDVLLVQGNLESLHDLQESGDVLLVEGVERTMTSPQRAPCAIGILGAVVLLAALNVAPLLALAFLGIVVMLVTRCLTMADATRSLDSSVLLLLAGTIPLGTAMTTTGIATKLGQAMVSLAGGHPLLTLSLCFLLTSMLTEVVSNNATAALLTPVALAVAAEAGINPKAMLMAVVFGASSSFATPMGYQTNAMVMGAGGYLFRDYLRLGLPLKLVFW